MTLPIRERLLQAFYARLDIPGYHRFRLPSGALAKEQLPALVMVDGGADLVTGPVGTYRVQLRVQVLCVCRGSVTPDAAGDSGLGAAWGAAYAAVRAAVAPDPSLGGLAHIVRFDGCGDPDLVVEQGVSGYGALPVDFVIDHDEDLNDPFAQ